MMKHEFDTMVGLTTAPECYERIEYVYMNSDQFPTKADIADFYKKYDMHGIERIYRELKKDERIRDLEAKLAEATKPRKSPTGTQMLEPQYAALLVGSGSTMLNDAEAVLLINKEFGFEASKIEILQEAELDIAEPGSRYVKTKQVPRPPMYAATDWNYVRFNIHCRAATWYYEMINAQLYEVCI